MARSQVLERLQADPAFRLSACQPEPNRLSAFTTIGNYESFLRFDFDRQDRLTLIRISVGEVGGRFVDDQALPYFYNCLRTRFGNPKVAWDTYDNLDIYTWDLPGARRTLAAIHYWVPTGRFLLVYITDPRKPMPEEKALRRFEDTGKKFRNLNHLPERQRIAYTDF